MKQNVVTRLASTTSTSGTPKITTFISTVLPARADYYRAYENYVALSGRGIRHLQGGRRPIHIPRFQRTVGPFTMSAANAMTVAAKRCRRTGR